MNHANDNAVISYATLCSGIESLSAAVEPLGNFEPVFFSEIAAFQSRFLAHKFPGVPNLGDMTAINGAQWAGRVDVLWASTPCQSFSAAGNRLGADDPRGALTQTFVEIANEINPTVVVWENVKGVLSDGNNAFGEMLGGLAGCGQAVVAPDGRWKNAGCVVGPKRNIAWRVLDAKHGGVPQQRRRVFLVGCPSSGPDPAEILFESKAVRRNFTEGDPVQPKNPATAPVYFNCDSRPKFSIEYAHPLKADKGSGGRGCVFAANDNPRRLTPLECERLMGFPEGWTDLPGARDSDRWSSLGNAVAVTDARWIGQRIKEALRSAA